jgi:hypothetical protein
MSLAKCRWRAVSGEVLGIGGTMLEAFHHLSVLDGGAPTMSMI